MDENGNIEVPGSCIFPQKGPFVRVSFSLFAEEEGLLLVDG
jgi:hypothetical protein